MDGGVYHAVERGETLFLKPYGKRTFGRPRVDEMAIRNKS
jgi:hypothetical protein